MSRASKCIINKLKKFTNISLRERVKIARRQFFTRKPNCAMKNLHQGSFLHENKKQKHKLKKIILTGLGVTVIEKKLN